MKGKKKKVAAAGTKASKAGKAKVSKDQRAADKRAKQLAKDTRRAAKLERRRTEKRLMTREMWAVPAPADLVGKLPTIKSKYHSYFEFAENTEKKDKKLEFQVTNRSTPPPGFKFVPIGDPTLTNMCKELSRRDDAMIFIVSSSKEEKMKISAHIFRVGYHFRETIVDEASEIIGETAVVNKVYNPNDVEPIPESQDEINKQADAAIRDLFPRIPNTDRQMILDHAFKKGALFHGEPTVGLQSSIPLSRRVQLAVLAHIRHTHTRYDLLLRETTWMNARKVVEPICLDVLVKWRGDEETGRDQMEEILREVIVLTDSEESDDSSEEEDSSDDDDEEATSASTGSISQPSSRNQHRPGQPQIEAPRLQGSAVSADTRVKDNAIFSRDKKAQRGFKRYQAAWDHARTRQQEDPIIPEAGHGGIPVEGQPSRRPMSGMASSQTGAQYPSQPMSNPAPNASYGTIRERPRYDDNYHIIPRQDSYYSQQQGSAQTTNSFRDEVILRPATEHPRHYQTVPRPGTPSYATRDQGQPVLVRDSPTGYNLQDLLVPSIETASSDAANEYPRSNTRYVILDSPQESHPRRIVERAVEPRRRSPEARQVITINDDSPQNKRRRVVYEDDHGHFRPLPPRDQGLYYAAPRPESHLLPASSVQSRELLVPSERMPSRYSQPVFRDEQPSMARPVAREQLPIYNASPQPGASTSLYGRHGRVEVGATPIGDSTAQERMDVPPFYSANARENTRRVNANMALVEKVRDHANEAQSEFRSNNPFQRALPAFHPPSERYHTDETGPAPRDGYQVFLNNFSEARLEPPLQRARDHSTVAPERYAGSASQVSYQPRYEDRPSASFMTLRPGEAGSPVRYVERPMHMQEERLPVFYGTGHTATDRHRAVGRPPLIRDTRPPPEGDSPTYVRTVQRPVIILD